MRKLTLLLLITFSCASAVSAQEAYRGEIFGSIGVVRFDRFELSTSSNLGTSVIFGGGAGLRPFSKASWWHRLGLEGEVNTFDAGTRGTNMLTTLTGNGVLHFSTGKVQPYVLLGFGRSFQSGGSAATGDLGGGVKIFTNKHFSFRPEFRLFGTEELDAFIRGSVALSYHW
jgi:hypothetical protein